MVRAELRRLAMDGTKRGTSCQIYIRARLSLEFGGGKAFPKQNMLRPRLDVYRLFWLFQLGVISAAARETHCLQSISAQPRLRSGVSPHLRPMAARLSLGSDALHLNLECVQSHSLPYRWGILISCWGIARGHALLCPAPLGLWILPMSKNANEAYSVGTELSPWRSRRGFRGSSL